MVVRLCIGIFEALRGTPKIFAVTRWEYWIWWQHKTSNLGEFGEKRFELLSPHPNRSDLRVNTDLPPWFMPFQAARLEVACDKLVRGLRFGAYSKGSITWILGFQLFSSQQTGRCILRLLNVRPLWFWRDLLLVLNPLKVKPLAR